MIERNKKLILILAIEFTVAVIVPFIVFLITKNPDFFSISFIISTLLILLYINMRSSRFLTLKQKSKYFKDKMKKRDIEEYKEEKRILWIDFAIQLLITVILCLISFI